MKENIKALGFILLIFAMIYFGIIFPRNMVAKRELITKEKLENYIYFCGQRDAINNNIKIKRISDTTWIWLKSPEINKTRIVNDTIYDY